MSIDLNWDTLTGGSDGNALAEHIRDFIHTKFQSVPLPRFIKSVTVHDFAFGKIPPEVVLKDICDPLPDFYEDDFDESGGEDEDGGEEGSGRGGREGPNDGVGRGSSVGSSRGSGVGTTGFADRDIEEQIPDAIRLAERRRRAEQRSRLGLDSSARNEGQLSLPPHIHIAGLRSAPGTPADLGSPFLGLGASTPGIPGGTSNMHYFQSKLGAGWSGTQTPLAAVAGAQHLGMNGWLDSTSPQSPQSPLDGWPSASSPPRAPSQEQGQAHRHGRHHSQSSISIADFQNSFAPAPPPPLREKHSVSTLAPTSAGTSRPPTRDPAATLAGSAIDEEYDAAYPGYPHNARRQSSSQRKAQGTADQESPHDYQEPRPDDMQAVFRIKYAGDVRLELTAEILLDYPMPSFVGIPVKLNITGLTFDGVGVVAYIRRRVHFCFLSPEDALAAVGADEDEGGDDGAGELSGQSTRKAGRFGGLLQEIRVESEIGQREGTKQSLKNVGKVEKFVLEQVRRIFEEEFIFPSFWTFLV
ncbi:hypothetical protein F5Y15DRAFT_386733 [Xylariaceae sp. FL0016]|nr:hypothetical protein F5Y15DRAFT_386733 [Xylariaceae sp. FL0016]